MGKAISDAEGLLANKEAELTNLKEDTSELEECDPAAEHESDLDGTA
jgi:kinetochore protein Spc24, fungi type